MTKKDGAAAKHRDSERERYKKLPLAKRRKIVQERDKQAQRDGDARRYAKDKAGRDAYHREQAKAVKGVPTGGVCSRCGSKRNVERHHSGGKIVKLCATCHAKARRKR